MGISMIFGVWSFSDVESRLYYFGIWIQFAELRSGLLPQDVWRQFSLEVFNDSTGPIVQESRLDSDFWVVYALGICTTHYCLRVDVMAQDTS